MARRALLIGTTSGAQSLASRSNSAGRSFFFTRFSAFSINANVRSIPSPPKSERTASYGQAGGCNARSNSPEGCGRYVAIPGGQVRMSPHGLGA